MRDSFCSTTPVGGLMPRGDALIENTDTVQSTEVKILIILFGLADLNSDLGKPIFFFSMVLRPESVSVYY